MQKIINSLIELEIKLKELDLQKQSLLKQIEERVTLLVNDYSLIRIVDVAKKNGLDPKTVKSKALSNKVELFKLKPKGSKEYVYISSNDVDILKLNFQDRSNDAFENINLNSKTKEIFSQNWFKKS